MSHAKMYTGEHGDVQMIAFLHAQSQSKHFTLNRRAWYRSLGVIFPMRSLGRSKLAARSYFSTRSNLKISLLALG